MTYSYIRVSIKDQNEDRQFLALHDLNIPLQNIYLDKQSGMDGPIRFMQAKNNDNTEEIYS